MALELGSVTIILTLFSLSFTFKQINVYSQAYPFLSSLHSFLIWIHFIVKLRSAVFSELLYAWVSVYDFLLKYDFIEV